MDNSSKIIPPHLNAEIYRKETTGTCTQSYLDFVRTHKDGSILVGCSELTGRYWNGGALVYQSNDENKSPKNSSKKHISLTSSTADGCFTESSNKVILCDDTGAISIWSRNDDAWKVWNEEASVAEHDSAILAIESLDPEKTYITAGGDGHVKVWDVSENMLCIRNYSLAHSMPIHGVSVKPMSQSHFVTGSLDCFISLWDEHTDKPVYDVIENDCGIRCLQWIEENKIVFGDESGMLALIDVRNSDNVIKLCKFPASIHRISFNPESNNIAVCCDNRKVTVFNIKGDKSKVLHENTEHSNFVRGVAWDQCDPNILHTVGWDGELKQCNVNK
ncbi:methylosome protein 50-like [Zerene cesonia]|uniref:methylosome protein 50-like n=1 Tax=Zerene cesonia TaxID=33412 RepID=UPI0018E4E22A|nr:methylosome protein 50-like [Zerene cesonia]